MPNDRTPPCKVTLEGDYYVVRDSKYKKQYESREKRYADMEAERLNKKQVMNATTPFDSGYYAAGEGKPRSANPHLNRGKDREDWFAGWQKKQTEKTGSSSTFGNSAFQNGRMKAEQAIVNKMTDYLDPYAMKKIGDYGTKAVYEDAGEFGVYAKGNGQLLRSYPDKQSAIEFAEGKR